MGKSIQTTLAQFLLLINLIKQKKPKLSKTELQYVDKINALEERDITSLPKKDREKIDQLLYKIRVKTNILWQERAIPKNVNIITCRMPGCGKLVPQDILNSKENPYNYCRSCWMNWDRKTGKIRNEK